MVEVRYKARLGNNLFQYCLGRILAEGLGFALQADPIPGFPNTAQPVAGAVHQGPEQVVTGQRIPLERMLADRNPRRIVLDGWFQRHEYYWPYRTKIRQWLRFDSNIRVPDVGVDVVLHVRRTDFIQLGWALPFSFYSAALERLIRDEGRVWIVTDDRHDPFFRRFSKWRPKVFPGTALQHMLFMARAPKLVMSQSTFSWWPTFLGDPQVVVCPLPSFGAWSEQCEPWSVGINLIECDRFVCLECKEPYHPLRAEARHQRWRLLKRRVILKLNRTFRIPLLVPPF
ncbi:MAG: hypothetical protein HY650_13500 [Acidobacteria bacterium]|nr:hypothetical protein [Acidobacteriota bacterium]